MQQRERSGGPSVGQVGEVTEAAAGLANLGRRDLAVPFAADHQDAIVRYPNGNWLNAGPTQLRAGNEST